MHQYSIKTVDGTQISPQTIYGIGRNYAEHARELAHEIPTEPIVFLKSLASLRPLDQGGIAYPGEVFHHEAEVVLLVGKGLPLGSVATWNHISGIALGLDLTRREVQNALKAKGLPWTKAKCFLGAAPLSPFIPTARFPDPDRIRFTLEVGGEPRQSGNTSDMLHSAMSIMHHLLQFTDLCPGDLIFTGTPSGVGPICQGDSFKLAFVDLGLAFSGQL